MITNPINRPIIEPHEVALLSRPCDCDDDVIRRAIEEAELLDIKPRLGDALFLRLTTDVKFDRLMNGGEYTDKNGRQFVFAGLKRTLAYYVWARLVKTSTNRLTRFGYVVKDDEHSHSSEWKERQVAYNDAFAVADGYFKQCFAYMLANPDIFADYTKKGVIKSNRVKFKIIGN